MRDWIPFLDLILRWVVGSKQQRDLKRLDPIADLVGLLERTVHARSDDWFEKRTEAYRDAMDERDRTDWREYYREQLKQAQTRLESLSIDEEIERLRRTLESNRGELIEAYKDDAFTPAIKKPLKDESIEGLIEAYRSRLQDWQDDDTEAVLRRFDELWSHHTSKAPDDEREKDLWWALPACFATVREAAHRRLGLRHYDVQVVGAVALHEGRIAEMKTGEGKTLAATMPLYLNALTGKGAHLVTVNDYLAERDSKWMGEIYEKLGLSVGLIQEGDPPRERQPDYDADVTYGTNSQFGFDYLRDNMVVEPDNAIEPDRFFTIIDEVDSVLIDEARTPLIISGPAEEDVEIYRKVDRAVRQLDAQTDYEADAKKETVSLTDSGADKIEEFFGLDNLYAADNMELVQKIEQAVKAHELYELDAEYVVKNDEVVIVDEFTGRLQPDRRFGEGLHQALEAKENVTIEQETQTLATITIQNFFRMYDKLSGMTGTADTEAQEFSEIYDLDVVVVPTHEPDIRVDHEDAIYQTEGGKFQAVVERIKTLHEAGRPALVGTVDIDKSEKLGQMLDRENIPHNILNAKNHEREAAIIAQAGEAGAVTIATNMAGRGTDIVLGEGAIKEGCPIQEEGTDEPHCPHDPICGLHVIGTERHESRRIDNQLRGRAARQGEPGASRFFVSLDDEVMQLFGSDRLSGFLETVGVEEGQRLEHSWLSGAIKRAQSKVESRNFEIRKNLLEYDDVMERQRSVIYKERRRALHEGDMSERVLKLFGAEIDYLIDEYAGNYRSREWLSELTDAMEGRIGWAPDNAVERWGEMMEEEAVREALLEDLIDFYGQKEDEFGSEPLREVESQLYLQVIDNHWKDHLNVLDHLKQDVQMAGMAKKKPIAEYKRRSFRLFGELQKNIRGDFISFLLTFEVAEDVQQQSELSGAQTQHDVATMEDIATAGDDPSEAEQHAQEGGGTVVKDDEPGRNDPCPCGSGDKYKYCHGG